MNRNRLHPHWIVRLKSTQRRGPLLAHRTHPQHVVLHRRPLRLESLRRPSIPIHQHHPRHQLPALVHNLVHETGAIVHRQQTPVERHQLGQLHAASLERILMRHLDRFALVPLHLHAVRGRRVRQPAALEVAAPRVLLVRLGRLLIEIGDQAQPEGRVHAVTALHRRRQRVRLIGGGHRESGRIVLGRIGRRSQGRVGRLRGLHVEQDQQEREEADGQEDVLHLLESKWRMAHAIGGGRNAERFAPVAHRAADGGGDGAAVVSVGHKREAGTAPHAGLELDCSGYWWCVISQKLAAASATISLIFVGKILPKNTRLQIKLFCHNT